MKTAHVQVVLKMLELSVYVLDYYVATLPTFT